MSKCRLVWDTYRWANAHTTRPCSRMGDVSRMWMSRVTHIWMSHITRESEACHTCGRVTRIQKSCAKIRIGCATHMNEPCDIYIHEQVSLLCTLHSLAQEMVMSHMWLRHTNTSFMSKVWYGVATISRLLKITGLFCKRALWKRRFSAKETYDFKEPTNRSHPIGSRIWMKLWHLWICKWHWCICVTWLIHQMCHHVTHMNGWDMVCMWHTYEWDMWHIWMRHMTHMNETCDTHIW